MPSSISGVSDLARPRRPWSSRRKAFVVLGQFGISAVLLWYLLGRSDVAEIGTLLRTAAPWPIAFSTLAIFGRLPLSGYRWHLLLEPDDPRITVGMLTGLNLCAHFFLTLMPGAIGADLSRGYLLTRLGVTPARVTSTVVADRLIGILGLVVLALPCAVGLALYDSRYMAAGLTVGMLAMGATVAIAAARSFRFDRWRLPTGLTTLATSWQLTARNGRLLGTTVSLAVVFHLVGVIAVIAAGRAVGDSTPAFHYLTVVPLIWLWSALPLSVAGLGIREGAFVFYFALAGVPREVALAISAISLAQSLLQAAVGGLLIPVVASRLGTPSQRPDAR